MSHLPCFIDASAAGSFRASDSSCAIASSATLMLLAPGAFMTTMPRALAASTLTLSTPVPARAIARSFLRRGDDVRRDFRGAAHDERVGFGQVVFKFFGGST